MTLPLTEVRTMAKKKYQEFVGFFFDMVYLKYLYYIQAETINRKFDTKV